MLAGTAFFFLRVFQIITLIPIWGILAYFVHQYDEADTVAPDTILCLFVVSLLATVWALATLFLFHRGRFTDLWVAVVDLCFFGVLIAGVVLLGRVAENTDCVNSWAAGNGNGYFNYGFTWDRTCSMYKAAWALGILNVLLFFFSAVVAAMIWRRGRSAVVERRGRYW